MSIQKIIDQWKQDQKVPKSYRVSQAVYNGGDVVEWVAMKTFYSRSEAEKFAFVKSKGDCLYQVSTKGVIIYLCRDGNVVYSKDTYHE